MNPKATAPRAARHAKGRGTVTLPRRQYERLLRELEDLRDAQRLNAADAAAGRREYLPIDAVKRMRAGEHPVRVWREHRGLTLAALSERSGVDLTYISQIETKKKPGSARALKALAQALDVDLDDLVP